MKLHLFLPENDLALAAGIANYTPPQAAARLRDAGAPLPLWYGDADDRAVCAVNNDWYERMATDFALTTDVFDSDEIPLLQCAPWGWSTYARSRFSDLGIPPGQLPDDEQLAQLRELSHRRTGAALARLLQQAMPEIVFTQPATEVTDPKALQRAISDAGPEGVVIKTPFSSSGRGVWFSADTGAECAFRLGNDAIRRQGSVMVEERHNKVIDFARLYSCDDGVCRELGTSVFATNEHGAYTGNLLAPEDTRLTHVGALYPVDVLLDVSAQLRAIIEREIAPFYNGVLGVDMLVTADGVLDPVVELNLRTTMGYVANRFRQLHMHPESTGTFTVAPASAGTKPDDYTVVDHRIQSGTLNLVPANPHFSFTVTCK